MRSRITKAEFVRLRLKFGHLVIDLKNVLCTYMCSFKCTYTFTDLWIGFCAAASSNINGHLSVVSTNETLQNARSIEDMFKFLSEKCSLYDYELLTLFVGVSKCNEADKLMGDFNEEIKESLLKKLNLLDIYDDHRRRDLPYDENRKLTVKCENKDLHITAEDETLICNMLCKLFRLPHFSVLLVDITKGCIALIYEISQEVKEHLLQCNVTCQVVEVREFVITKLIIDDEWELQMSSSEVCLVYYDTEYSVLVNQMCGDDDA